MSDLNPDRISSYVKDLVRLALFTHTSKRCLRRNDIHHYVFKNERIHTQLYTQVMNHANLMLSDTFGLVLEPASPTPSTTTVTKYYLRSRLPVEARRCLPSTQLMDAFVVIMVACVYVSGGKATEKDLERYLTLLHIPLSTVPSSSSSSSSSNNSTSFSYFPSPSSSSFSFSFSSASLNSGSIFQYLLDLDYLNCKVEEEQKVYILGPRARLELSLKDLVDVMLRMQGIHEGSAEYPTMKTQIEQACQSSTLEGPLR